MGASTNFRALTLFIATALCCVGTGVSQIKQWNGTTRVHLYKTEFNGESFDHHKILGCKAYNERFDAAFAFAIISCIVIGAAFVLAALQLVGSSLAQVGKVGSTGLTAFGFITSLISWALVVGTFRAAPCDGIDDSLKTLGFAIDTGCQLLICTCGIMFVNLFASAANFFDEEEIALPDPFVPIRSVILFIAAVLVTLGTGLPQLALNDPVNHNADVKLYLYQYTEGHSVHKINAIDCTTLNRRIRAAYALAIISCILIVLAFTTVILKKAVTKVASVGLSFFAIISTLIAWAIVAATWYRDGICTDGWGFKSGGFKISSGLVLLVVSFILMVIDFIVAVASLIISPVAAAAAAAATTAEPSATADEEPMKEQPATAEPTEETA